MNTVTIKVGNFLFTYIDTSYRFMIQHHGRLKTLDGGLRERIEKLGMNLLYCADVIKDVKTGKVFKNRFGPSDEFTRKEIDLLYHQVSTHQEVLS